MIEKIEIINYRGISNAVLHLRPLTIFTGVNSAGKSTCINAILNLLYHNNCPNAKDILRPLDFTFQSNRNRNVNADYYDLKATLDDGRVISVHAGMDSAIGVFAGKSDFDLENNYYYLSANRLGYSYEKESLSDTYSVGLQGEYLFGALQRDGSNRVDENLVRYEESYTLSAQVNYWLSYILNMGFEVQAQKITYNQVDIQYKTNGLDKMNPQFLGTGVSYLAKILIMCLRAHKNDVLMIENPEIHLHPAAQSRLGEFFAFVANAGIQLILETHCEHLLDKIQYCIFKHQFDYQNGILYYKEEVEGQFLTIDYLPTGQYATEFPEGYFDATLSELMEME